MRVSVFCRAKTTINQHCGKSQQACQEKGLMQLFSLGLVFRPNLLLVFISKVRLEYDCRFVGTTLEGQKNLTLWP